VTDAILDFPEKSSSDRILIQLRWGVDLIAIVDRWRTEQNIPTRTKAIEELVRFGISAHAIDQLEKAEKASRRRKE
jgi:hypothetical protein